MEVFDETWYKDLKETDTFYTNVAALKIPDHLTKFCLGLHTVNAVDIRKLKKTLFDDVDGIPQFINAMEAAHKKSKRAKLTIQEKDMQAVSIKLIFKLGE